MSRIVAPPREWISSVNNSYLDTATSWMKVISCTDSAVQRNEFELIPMVQMESQHSIGAATSRDFPRFVIILQISRPEVGSHSRWYQKSVKSCVIYRTKNQKKIGSLCRSLFCAARAQNLPGPAANNVLTLPQISSKSVHFQRSYSRTREHRSNAP